MTPLVKAGFFEGWHVDVLLKVPNLQVLAIHRVAA
jgi:hypothetical protein